MKNVHRMLGIATVVLAGGAAVADMGQTGQVVTIAQEIASENDHISATMLAERIMAREPGLQVFDLRSSNEFTEFHIPTASLVTMEEIATHPWPKTGTIVLYSEGGAHSAQAWVLMRLRGYSSVYVLREGIYEWLSRVHDPRLATDATPAEIREFERTTELSRYFGGSPLSGVPRAEVPTGYWTVEAAAGAPADGSSVAAGDSKPAPRVRRRGC